MIGHDPGPVEPPATDPRLPRHPSDPSPDALAHMHGQLARVSAVVFDGHYVDDNMRNIPDHYHAHARPQGGFFGHGQRKDKPSP